MVAIDAHAAAGKLHEASRWRSAISRAYYATYASSHAILAHLGTVLPVRGNLTHKELPGTLQGVLIRSKLVNSYRARVYRSYIEEDFRLRVSADYNASMPASFEGSKRSMTHASAILILAREMIL